MNKRLTYLTSEDIGKRVKFSPHPDSLVYELCLEGKSGIIKNVRNCIFDQEVTVDFNFVLEFSEKPKLKKIRLSPHTVCWMNYRTKWVDDASAEKYGRRDVIVKVGDILTTEQIKTYNNHYQHWGKLDENVEYKVIEYPDDRSSIWAEYVDPSSKIGPIWKVSRDNLVWDN